jgi:hypothetical protein
VRAIETLYDGYLFRSRTEARWAVFWKHIGLPFVYEREGYDLGGTYYLPDYFIPAFDAFVEIKADPPTGEAIRKCELLHKGSGKIVLLLHGQPWHHGYRALLFDRDTLANAGEESRPYLEGVILQCRRCECLVFVAQDEGGEPYVWQGLGHKNRTCDMGTCVEREPELTDALQAAFKAARRERFERR